MRRRFFVERFENRAAVLRGAAAHHLGRVLRAEPGNLYELSDGETLWLARTERVAADAIEFRVGRTAACATLTLYDHAASFHREI